MIKVVLYLTSQITKQYPFSLLQVLELQQMVATLLNSLTEENGPNETQTAMNVVDALDMEAVYNLMNQYYVLSQVGQPNLKVEKCLVDKPCLSK